MNNKIIINCEEATSICDKNQYGEVSLWDKIRLNIHMFTCKICKSYSSQNHIITILIGKHIGPCDDSNHFSLEEKQVMEKKLIQRMEE